MSGFKSGAIQGAGIAMASSALSWASIPNSGTHDGNGQWMTQEEYMEYARTHPGAVAAATQNSISGKIISILTGGGPFSHIQGVDASGNIVETNSESVSYLDASSSHFDSGRMMFVTDSYVSQNAVYNGPDVINSFGQRGWGAYGKAGLCSGSARSIATAYPGGSPNSLYYWNSTSMRYQAPIWGW